MPRRALRGYRLDRHHIDDGARVDCIRRARLSADDDRRLRADFVRGLAIERKFDDAVAPFPAQGFAGEGFHVDLEAYNASICDAKRSLMAARRSLPIAVRRPASGVRVSRKTVKLRI